jgi:hypothetical protein
MRRRRFSREPSKGSRTLPRWFAASKLAGFPRVFDLTPLGHPIWWGALALLLINDNLFKGKAVVPGWLTGKLSDFAFLIVAPTLFAALLPRRVPGRRTFAVAAVVALYVAADLSRAVSDAVVAVAARVGFHWRLWPDTTDLLALAVLPITVWLLRRSPRPQPATAAARRSSVQRERAGVVLGALACLATSDVGGYAHRPFLFNRTAASADVRITWVLRKVDCDGSAETLASTLGPSDLDDPRMVTMGTATWSRWMVCRRPGCPRWASARRTTSRTSSTERQLSVRRRDPRDAGRGAGADGDAAGLARVRINRLDQLLRLATARVAVRAPDRHRSQPGRRGRLAHEPRRNAAVRAVAHRAAGGRPRHAGDADPAGADRSRGGRGAAARRGRLPRDARRLPRAARRHGDPLHV